MKALACPACKEGRLIGWAEGLRCDLPDDVCGYRQERDVEAVDTGPTAPEGLIDAARRASARGRELKEARWGRAS